MTAGTWRRRLSVLVLIWGSLALVPIVAIAVWQAQSLADEADARDRATLLALTEMSVNPFQSQLEQGFGVLGGLVPLLSRTWNDAAGCEKLLADVARANPGFGLAATDLGEGQIRCAADLPGSNRLAEGTFALLLEREARAGGRKPDIFRPDGTGPLILYEPVFGDDGQRLGILALSLPEQEFRMSAPPDDMPVGIVVKFFTPAGEILATNLPQAASSYLPVENELEGVVADRSISFQGMDGTGAKRDYAMIPVKQGIVYAIGTLPGEPLPGLAETLWRTTVGIPLLMGLVSLSVAYLGLDRLVIKPVRHLRETIQQFSSTRSLPGRPKLLFAAQEFSELEQSIHGLGEAILKDEERLAANIGEKNALLREVHHRVQNNLQLISSIINMQIRLLEGPEARMPMKRMQERVMALASVHRSLYRSQTLVEVGIDAIAEDLVRDFQRTASVNGDFEFSADLQPAKLSPDRAVAFSMCLAEMLNWALAEAPVSDKPHRVEVRFLNDDLEEDFVLVVSCTAISGDWPRRTSDNLGQKLIDGFARQLNGSARTAVDETERVIELRFPKVEAYS